VKRWIPRIVVLAVLAGAGIGVWLWRPWDKGDNEITFSTVTVGKGTIAAQVTAAGTLSAKITVQVGAQVSGIVKELGDKGVTVDFNSKVKKGQIIAKLDDTLLKAQVDQMQAAYDNAVANQKKADVAEFDGIRQYNREKGLEDQHLIAAQTVEGFEVTRDQAIAALVAAKAATEQAYANDHLLADRRRRAHAQLRHRPDRAELVLGADAVHDRRRPHVHADRHGGRRR
jgi:HlyD family secretion protein